MALNSHLTEVNLKPHNTGSTVNKAPISPINSSNINTQIRTPEYQAELEQLRKRSNDEPGNVDLWWLLAEFYNRHEESDEALKYFEAVLKNKIVKNPRQRQYFYYQIYRGFSKAYTQKVPPQYDLAMTYLQKSAASITNTILITEDVSVLLATCKKDMGLIKLNCQQYSEAAEDLSQALQLLGEKMPGDPLFSTYHTVKIEILEHRILAYLHLADSDKTFLDLYAVLKEYSFDFDKYSDKRAQMYFQIGFLYSTRGSYAEAISYYHNALDESKRSGHELPQVAVAEIFLQFSVYYYTIKDYGKSTAYCDISLKLQQNNEVNLALVYRTLSSCCVAINEVDGALNFSTHALSLAKNLQSTHPFDFAESSAAHARACFLNRAFSDALTHAELALKFHKVSLEKHKAGNPSFCDQVKITMAEVQALKGDALFYKADYMRAVDYKACYTSAVAAYKVALSEKKVQTGDNYFKHGFCLHASGQLDKAVIPYREAIKRYSEETLTTSALKRAFVLNRLATLYHEKNQINEARKNFKLALTGFEDYGKKIMTSADESELQPVEGGHCSVTSAEINIFQGLELYFEKHLTVAHIHLHLADLCVAEEKFIEAETHYLCAFEVLSIQTADTDRKYAACCVALKKSQEAITYYTRSKEKSKLAPENQVQAREVAFALGQLYFEQGDFLQAKENFLLALNDVRQADATLHMYLGDIYARENEFATAQSHYVLALEEPTLQTATAYYKLWCVYYSQGNHLDAAQYFKEALPATQKNAPNDAHHQELVQMALEEIQSHDREAFDIKKYDYVILPPIIKALFKELKEIYPQVFLGGSTMHALLMGQPLNPGDKDLDFFALGEASNRLNEELNFHTCVYNPNLYIKKMEGFSVDCYVTTKKEDDFTIANLYCDENGKIHDFGKWGVDDFYARRLSTVSEKPEVVFQQNPVVLLRVTKYKHNDFRPTPKLQKAVNEFIPSTNHTQNRLIHARMRIMLKSLPPSHLITWLKADRLLEKLFGIDNQLPDEEALTQLNNVVKLPTSPIRQSQSRDTFLAASSAGSSSATSATAYVGTLTK